MTKAWQRFLGYLSVFLTLITGCIFLTINFYPLYRFDITYLNIPQATGLSKEALLENFRQLMAYLNFFWIKKLQMSNFPTSESGAFHFYEVKQLFMLDYVLFFCLIIPSIWFLLQMRKTGQNWRIHSLFKKATWVPLLFMCFMILGFDNFFLTFHQVFFNNDAWLFNPETDPVILALPEEFFMHSFILAFLLFEISLGIGIFLTREKKKATFL